MMVWLILSVFSLYPGGGIAKASVLEHLSLPSGSSVSWVGQGINQNGIALDIMEIKSKHRPADVIGHFRQLWSSNVSASVPETIETSLAHWSLISTMKRGISIVVQVSPQSSKSTQGTSGINTSGFISMIDTKDISGTGLGNQLSIHDIALPPGSSVMSLTKTNEHGSQADTLVAINNMSVSQNYLFFMDNLARSGWQSSLRLNRNGVATLGYSKLRHYCGISVAQGNDGQSVVLISRVSYQ